MPKGPEQDLQDAAVDLLHRFGFLVFHQRPALTKDGGYVSAVAYDGAGFPDLVAARPGAPVLFVEVKAGSSVSENQRDWLEALATRTGRLALVLTPGSWRAFMATVIDVDATYPLPDGWLERLTQRAWRTTMKKGKDKIMTSLRNTGTLPATMNVKMIDGHPPVFKVGTKIFTYKGHGVDESICGYGPCVYDGSKSRWVPTTAGRFRCFPKDTKIVTNWKGLPHD